MVDRDTDRSLNEIESEKFSIFSVVQKKREKIPKKKKKPRQMCAEWRRAKRKSKIGLSSKTYDKQKKSKCGLYPLKWYNFVLFFFFSIYISYRRRCGIGKSIRNEFIIIIIIDSR